MPTLGRKLRLFVAWTWSMFFATDVMRLRFTRSHDLADPPEGKRTRQDQSVVRGARETT